jgi:hypothetical protein
VPGQAQVDGQGSLGSAVPGGVAHHDVDRGLLGLHHVTEVTPQQGVRATGRVVQTGGETVAAQGHVGKQAPLQQGVVPCDEFLGPYIGRCCVPVGTLKGEPDLPAELAGCRPPVVDAALYPPGEGVDAEGRMRTGLLVRAVEEEYGRAGRPAAYPADDIRQRLPHGRASHQDAHRSAARGGHVADVPEGAVPDQRPGQPARGQKAPDEDRVRVASSDQKEGG